MQIILWRQAPSRRLQVAGYRWQIVGYCLPLTANWLQVSASVTPSPFHLFTVIVSSQLSPGYDSPATNCASGRNSGSGNLSHANQPNSVISRGDAIDGLPTISPARIQIVM